MTAKPKKTKPPKSPKPKKPAPIATASLEDDDSGNGPTPPNRGG